MKNIFVGNLDITTTEDELRHLFRAYGTVATVTLVCDRDTSIPRGFGFVEMTTDSEADAAIEALNGTILGGRSLSINEARQKLESNGTGTADMRNKPRETLVTRKHRRHRY